MTKLQREIVKAANCDVLDHTLTTVELIKKDLVKRRNKQEKALVKAQAKGWSTASIVESIKNLNKTLEVINEF